ncbi:pyridoxal phosphate-dependent aminotransferase [Acidisarcina polymorpha]|nr:pyridoxal phosphate-dependent aminotransferase [Acidisarcina polymorpha]
MNSTISDLDLDLSELDIHGPTLYGYAPLREAVAAMKGVTAESVVLTTGTSMANHLAMSALFATGDEVLIEEPTYELILTTAQYLGARVRRFQRRAEDNYALDPQEVAEQLSASTRLIVLSNMHNPTSVLATEESLRAVGEMANEIGARILIDEVYLETLHHPPVPTSFLFGNQFVVTSSLTKAYGLSGLRCGWILAEPELAERIWRLNDLFAATPVHIAELLSLRAIEQIEKFGRRADIILDINRRSFSEILAAHPAIEVRLSPVGTTAFPRLREGRVPAFCDFLRDSYQTSVVPGSYFESPDYFRVGLAGDVDMTREGLLRLATALDQWKV